MESRNRNGLKRLRSMKRKRLIQKESSSPKRTPTKSSKHSLSANVIHSAMAEVDRTGKVPSHVGNVKLSYEDRLLVLSKRRDVGLWVQCSHPHCSKWRYVEEIKDPAEVPAAWYCHMNKDPNFDACSKPEQVVSKEIEEDLIENKFTAGSIVWAKFKNYPYWPGMVEDDPVSLQFYELDVKKPQKVNYYHVSFFDCGVVSQAWVPAASVYQFKDGNETFEQAPEEHSKYSSRIEKGKELALQALRMDISQRLLTFNGFKRYYSWKKQKMSLRDKRRMNQKRKHNFTETPNCSMITNSDPVSFRSDFIEDSDFESCFSYKYDYETDNEDISAYEADNEDIRTPNIMQSQEMLENSDGFFGSLTTRLKNLSRSLFGSIRKNF